MNAIPHPTPLGGGQRQLVLAAPGGRGQRGVIGLPAGGVALGSSVALSSTLASACSAVAAGAVPLRCTSKVIPASLWPGMEQAPVIALVMVPASRVPSGRA
jgi:hypothetical protein